MLMDALVFVFANLKTRVAQFRPKGVEVNPENTYSYKTAYISSTREYKSNLLKV